MIYRCCVVAWNQKPHINNTILSMGQIWQFQKFNSMLPQNIRNVHRNLVIVWYASQQPDICCIDTIYCNIRRCLQISRIHIIWCVSFSLNPTTWTIITCEGTTGQKCVQSANQNKANKTTWTFDNKQNITT